MPFGQMVETAENQRRGTSFARSNCHVLVMAVKEAWMPLSVNVVEGFSWTFATPSITTEPRVPSTFFWTDGAVAALPPVKTCDIVHLG